MCWRTVQHTADHPVHSLNLFCYSDVPNKSDPACKKTRGRHLTKNIYKSVCHQTLNIPPPLTSSALDIIVVWRTELMLRGQWSEAIVACSGEVVQMKSGVSSGLLNRDRAGSSWVRPMAECYKSQLAQANKYLNTGYVPCLS